MLVKVRFPEVIFGALLAVAIFALGAMFWSSQNSGQTTQAPSASHGGDEQDQRQQHEGLWDWLTHDAAGFFTIWLVIVGGGQLVLFYVQLKLIRESLDDAKIAADAAKDSADAAKTQAKVAEDTLTKLERPWIFVELVSDLHGSPDDAFEAPYALFDIVNHGRAPAIIEEFYGEITEAELRPGSSLLRDEFHGIVGPDKAMEKCKMHCPSGFTYDLAVSLADNTQFPVPKGTQNGWEIFLRMLIHYRDITGAAHISAFCWRYDHGVNRWVKFEEEPDGKEYNYLT